MKYVNYHPSLQVNENFNYDALERFAQADTYHKTYLDYQDFKQYVVGEGLTWASDVDRMEEEFHKLDTDDDEKINLYEWMLGFSEELVGKEYEYRIKFDHRGPLFFLP